MPPTVRLSLFRAGLFLIFFAAGLYTIYESHRTGRLMADIDPRELLALTIRESVDVNAGGIAPDYRFIGHLTDEPAPVMVKATLEQVRASQPGTFIGVYRTGRPYEPYVTQAAYDNARPFWPIAGFVFNWFAALGALFIGFVLYMVAFRRTFFFVERPQVQDVAVGDWARLDDRFAPLIKRLEMESRSNPTAYKLRLMGLASLGYIFLAAVLLGVIAATAALAYLVVAGHAAVVAKLLIPLGVLIYAVIRALWVTVSPPTGLVLTAADAPLLFDFLGALRRKTRGPHIHHVLVTEDMNAAIMQIPRLGLFGWQTNYLLLGLPILQALSPDQMKAVIAHEFGHLAGAHGKFSAWIYRIRKTWAQLAQQIAMRSQWSAFLFRGFFAWYAPFFSAYSFVFARANEYEADRFAAEAVGADVAGAALISVEMKAQHLSSVFWPEFERQVEMVPEPPTPPHAAMAQFFGGSASRGEASDLKALLARQTGLADTHPSLADRLKALGCAPIPCEPVETTAAAHFLDASLSRIVQQIDATWRSWAMPRWQERYADAAAARNQLQALRTKAGTEPLNGEECRDFATLTERFDGDDAALPLYRGVLAKRPADALISYLLGRLLLRRSDDEGIALIDAAMDADSDAILSGCDLIYGYLRARERYSDAERYRDRWIDRRDLLDRDEAERSTFAERDTVLPHELNSDAVADIVSQLGKWRVIRRAYVVRKELSAMPERPLLILVIETVRWPGSRKVPPDITNVLAQEVRMPGETLFARIGARHRGLRRKLRDVPDALIYQR